MAIRVPFRLYLKVHQEILPLLYSVFVTDPYSKACKPSISVYVALFVF